MTACSDRRRIHMIAGTVTEWLREFFSEGIKKVNVFVRDKLQFVSVGGLCPAR